MKVTNTAVSRSPIPRCRKGIVELVREVSRRIVQSVVDRRHSPRRGWSRHNWRRGISRALRRDRRWPHPEWWVLRRLRRRRPRR